MSANKPASRQNSELTVFDILGGDPKTDLHCFPGGTNPGTSLCGLTGDWWPATRSSGVKGSSRRCPVCAYFVAIDEEVTR